MKRNMNLVRALAVITANHEKSALQQAAVRPALREQFPALKPSAEQIVEHVHLMQEGGLVETNIQKTMSAKFFTSIRLTWEGQEFVANTRDERVWKTLKDKYGDTSLEVIKSVLPEIVKHIIGA